MPVEIAVGGLVSKVDTAPDPTQGIWQEVGTHAQFAAGAAGNVYLANWDNDFKNGGCVDVAVTKRLPTDWRFYFGPCVEWRS